MNAGRPGRVAERNIGKSQEKQERPESAVGAIIAGSDQGRSDWRRDRLDLGKVASSVLRAD